MTIFPLSGFWTTPPTVIMVSDQVATLSYSSLHFDQSSEEMPGLITETPSDQLQGLKSLTQYAFNRACCGIINPTWFNNQPQTSLSLAQLSPYLFLNFWTK